MRISVGGRGEEKGGGGGGGGGERGEWEEERERVEGSVNGDTMMGGEK